MCMGGARIFDVWEVRAKPRARENRYCWMFKSEETKIPMMKASKESVIYLQYTPLLVYLIMTFPLGNVDTQRNLTILNEYSVCLTRVESSKRAHSMVFLTTGGQWGPAGPCHPGSVVHANFLQNHRTKLTSCRWACCMAIGVSCQRTVISCSNGF